MASDVLFLFLTLMLTFSYAQRDKTFFRKDYNYIKEIQNFYKLHTLHKTWNNAQDTCEMEGATFFYPEDQNEADVIGDLWNKTQPWPRIYIGVSSFIAKGIFETVDGQPISDVYSNWAPGEPNDATGIEDCVLMRRDGTLNDVNCDDKYAFICKKPLSSLEWNTACNMPYTDYEYNESLGRCYKLHLEPKTWQEAFATCAYQQSYLAIINTQAEADLLTKMVENAPKNKVDDDQPSVHMGFHKRPKGWTTIKATKLENSGYVNWGPKQPDNKNGDENCVGMYYNGQLIDVSCSRKAFFICEHDVDTLVNGINERHDDEPSEKLRR